MPVRSNIDKFNSGIDRVLAEMPPYLDGTVEAINVEALDIAKSYTTKLVPGVNPNDGPRATHPGGWADRTSQAVNSFDHKVERTGTFTRRGVLLNYALHAIYLEALGYWVLSGLFEGVIQEIARKRLLELLNFLIRRMQ